MNTWISPPRGSTARAVRTRSGSLRPTASCGTGRNASPDQGPGSRLAAAVGKDLKGKISPLVYVVAIPLALLEEWVAQALYVAVALMSLVPDRRIERTLRE